MKSIKNKIFAGALILGASLIFGNLNKAKAQECECQTYNHDADEFPEEVICWKKEGFTLLDLKHAKSKAGITIISYSDKDNDNFHETIKLFNYGDNYSDFVLGYLSIEEFNIEKSAGLISYSEKRGFINNLNWNKIYSKKSPVEVIRSEIPEWFRKEGIEKNYPSLTIEQIYSLFPGFWNFYGGFGERTKKLINAGKNLDEIKKIVENERILWGYELKQ